jgi:hypothetical protein
MRRTGFLVLATLCLLSGCGRAPEAVHVTGAKELKDALGPLMLKHKLGLYVLKAGQSAPGADLLAGHPLLILCPAAEPRMDFDVAAAAMGKGTPGFSSFGSYRSADNVSCAGDEPCMTGTARLDTAGEASATLEQKIYGRDTSAKALVGHCLRQMSANQGVLLANHDAVASVSSQLLELVLE